MGPHLLQPARSPDAAGDRTGLAQLASRRWTALPAQGGLSSDLLAVYWQSKPEIVKL
jgi:hypothetical protein